MRPYRRRLRSGVQLLHRRFRLTAMSRPMSSALSGRSTTSTSSTRTGWTIGSGVEAALGGNWTGKVEYLYVDLAPRAAPLLSCPTIYSSEIREHIFGARPELSLWRNQRPRRNRCDTDWSLLHRRKRRWRGTALNKNSLQAAGFENFNLVRTVISVVARSWL